MTDASRARVQSGRQGGPWLSVPDSPHLLSVADAAAYLGVTVRTVWSLIADGTLPRVQLRRATGAPLRRTLVDRADLHRLVEAGKS